MPGIITCPNPDCRHRLAVPDGAPRSRMMRCRHCQTRIAASTVDGPAAASTPGGPAAGEGSGERPQRVGRFEVRQRLGAGAFAAVFRAYDPQLDREVALKVPHTGSLDSPKRVERFLREAKAAAGLRHPHIVPLYESGRDGDRYYIASAFIPGRTLGDALDGSKGWNPERAAKIARALAEALAYAHEEGIVHRDVKPANVMLDGKGQPLLMDFGLASRRDGESKLTNEGAVLGTPSYMAPEQASGKSSEAGPAADQYSLGCVLFELLTGETPFNGPPEVQIFHHVRTQPPSPRALRSGVPEDLAAVCLRCLEKDPRQRYADCEELAEDLRRVLAGEPTVARPLGPVRRLGRWASRNRLMAGLTAGLAAALVGGAAMSSLMALRAWRGEEEARVKSELAAKNAVRAEANAQQAEANATVAQANASRASENAAEARKLSNEAQAAKEKAVRKAEAGRRREYITALQLTQAAWDQHTSGRVADLLEAQRPQPGQVDLRGFEWHYWKNALSRGYIVLRGHQNGVVGACYSPDGKWIASSGSDKTVRLWDATTGHEKSVLTGVNATMASVCFSPDGGRLAASDFGATDAESAVRVWDVSTGNEILALKRRNRCVCFSPDGKRLALCGGDGFGGPLTLCELPDGRETRLIEGYWGRLSFSPDGRRLAAASQPEMIVRVWEFPGGKELFTLRGHEGYVTCLCYTPDGRHIVSGAQDGTLRVWDAATGKKSRILSNQAGMATSLDFSADGRRLAVGAAAGTVDIWDVDAGKVTLTLQGHTNTVRSVRFSPDGARLVSASSDKTLRIWDPSLGQQALALRGGDSGLDDVGLSPDGRWIVAVGGQGTIRIWNAASNTEKATLKPAGICHGKIFFSPDSKRFILAERNGTVAVWEIESGRQVLELKTTRNDLTCGCFSPDGRQIVTAGGKDKTIRVWDATNGKAVRVIEGPFGTFECSPFDVSFSADGSRFLAAALGKNRDGAKAMVRVWDAAITKPIVTFEKDFEWPGFSFSPNGRWIATQSHAGVEMWDAMTGKLAFQVDIPAMGWAGVVYTPDGRRFATGGPDGAVRVWDFDTLKETLVCRGQAGAVNAVTFSADGRRLAAATSSGTVLIWDARDGE